jgi:hypothetical protein
MLESYFPCPRALRGSPLLRTRAHKAFVILFNPLFRLFPSTMMARRLHGAAWTREYVTGGRIRAFYLPHLSCSEVIFALLHLAPRSASPWA